MIFMHKQTGEIYILWSLDNIELEGGRGSWFYFELIESKLIDCEFIGFI